jgi:hypothetical protein
MPLGLEASDRKLLTICGTILVVLLFATALLSPQKETEQSATPSTYSSQSAGAEAAYLLLQRLHYPVTRWEQVPTELPDDPSGTLLILASPTNFPEKRERDAIETFVTNGGHVLITGTMVSAFFKGSDVSESFASSNAAWTSYAPYAPSRVNRDAPKITLAPKATWGALNQTATALYGDPDAAVVVAWQHGKGEVLWWASATPLTNAGITRDDNLRFFLNSVGSWTKGEDYHIYWDEYFHGQRASLWSYASHTSILWGVVQIGVIAFAVVFTFSRRSGPTYRAPTRPPQRRAGCRTFACGRGTAGLEEIRGGEFAGPRQLGHVLGQFEVRRGAGARARARNIFWKIRDSSVRLEGEKLAWNISPHSRRIFAVSFRRW